MEKYIIPENINDTNKTVESDANPDNKTDSCDKYNPNTKDETTKTNLIKLNNKEVLNEGYKYTQFENESSNSTKGIQIYLIIENTHLSNNISTLKEGNDGKI
jgi:hypothetical protein